MNAVGPLCPVCRTEVLLCPCPGCTRRGGRPGDLLVCSCGAVLELAVGLTLELADPGALEQLSAEQKAELAEETKRGPRS